MTALEGVKVICVGQFYFAPYCSMLMARLGADVIKVEAPEGDPYRRLPTVDHDGFPIQFRFLNSGKRAIRLDLKQPAGQEILRNLVRTADVLVQNLSPGAMDRRGLGYEQLSAINPGLIMASGTGFGSFGPYAGEPAMDLTIQARSAIMSTTGFADGAPVRTGPSVVDFVAGTHMLGGVLAALFQRTRTGRGQHVEVALQDAIVPSLTSNIAGLLSSATESHERTGNRHGGLAVAPYNAYRTNDGWIAVLCPTDAHWRRLCELMGNPATDDPRFADMSSRCAHIDDVDAVVENWTRARPKDLLARMLVEARIPSAPVVTLPELLEDPHVRERGVLRTVTDEQGSFMTLGSPLFLSDSPMVEPSRAREVGADTDEVLTAELGMSVDDIAKLREAGVI
ncbi:MULTISPECIES: CaiB/BaiF CoA-transferase family protein [unclassified Parafrankia]|uniref:CaiB/BaiF CoA transferase family protein n=1 Tax=unclassified Parafrankia TaxID=2994368 RepID=UPI000DA4A506|nr:MULTISPECIES: CoA transferase [unclassified Parafrankia]TCJ31407.1 CoA transferase [Parafrankia sp. BMG5.11]CAI7976670.1 L-carnitine dehydratase/bile acid-inducible protein F [Frankia sp. Hr75.2]SQD95573.1 L-carnitine dehydratase/bile acid-inducible protein F [Parafrankia sp. Ea1.12]